MGVESQEIPMSDKKLAELKKSWEFFKSYRVWEAGRKIFFFPENYIHPDLRFDKTHLFKVLEQVAWQCPTWGTTAR